MATDGSSRTTTWFAGCSARPLATPSASVARCLAERSGGSDGSEPVGGDSAGFGPASAHHDALCVALEGDVPVLGPAREGDP